MIKKDKNAEKKRYGTTFTSLGVCRGDWVVGGAIRLEIGINNMRF